MKARICILAGAFFGLACASGCSLPRQLGFERTHLQSASSVEIYRQKALAAEKQGRPRQALWFWRAAAALDPDNTTIAGTIETLRRAIAKAAEARFRKGLDHYQQGRYDLADREFLTAVRLDPSHKQAKHFLKSRPADPKRPVHIVTKGDSFSKIAAQTYNDASMAAIIAYFNDMDPDKPLYIGTRLTLPVLTPAQLQPPPDIEALKDAARQALETGDYQQVHAIAGRIREASDTPETADALVHAAWYRQGLDLLDRKAYSEALALFKKVPAGYEARDRKIAEIEATRRDSAVETRLASVRHLLQQGSFGDAVETAEEVLNIFPANHEAQILKDKALYGLGKALIEKNEDARAVEVLKGLDSTYEDTAQLLAQARGRLNARAESLYRSGVKHFLNEELELAIRDWEEALTLNPKHPKAAQDIENARRLLKKWQGLDKEKQD